MILIHTLLKQGIPPRIDRSVEVLPRRLGFQRDSGRIPDSEMKAIKTCSWDGPDDGPEPSSELTYKNVGFATRPLRGSASGIWPQHRSSREPRTSTGHARVTREARGSSLRSRVLDPEGGPRAVLVRLSDLPRLRIEVIGSDDQWKEGGTVVKEVRSIDCLKMLAVDVAGRTGPSSPRSRFAAKPFKPVAGSPT